MKRTELSVGFRGHGESLALLLIRLSKKFLLMWMDHSYFEIGYAEDL